MTHTPPVCDYEGSDYQDRFWEEGGRAYEDGAEVLALKRLLPKGGSHLLELGAGAGRAAESAAGASSPAGTKSKMRLGLVTYNLAKDWDVQTIIKN